MSNFDNVKSSDLACEVIFEDRIASEPALGACCCCCDSCCCTAAYSVVEQEQN